MGRGLSHTCRTGWCRAVFALLGAASTLMCTDVTRADEYGEAGGPIAVLEQSDDPLRRAAAIRTLAQRLDDTAMAALDTALDDRHFHVRWLALRALSWHDGLDTTNLAELVTDAHPQVRRLAVTVVRERGLEGAIVPRLEAAATQDNAGRAAAALEALAQLERLSRPTLTEAIKHEHPRIRRTALMLATDARPDKLPADAVAHVLEDEDPVARALATEVLIAADALSLEQLEGVLADPVSGVRDVGIRALDELPKTEEVRRLRTIVRGVPLPKDQWRFATDPQQHGEDEGWFDPQFDDADWQRVSIERPWGEFGHEGYVGDGWYRREIDVPPELNAVEHLELHFEGVDESARVWVNGHPIGEHDIGPGGWDVPFSLDVTDHLRVGETNQITVRVRNTRGAGGIWRTVWLRPK